MYCGLHNAMGIRIGFHCLRATNIAHWIRYRVQRFICVVSKPVDVMQNEENVT
jgi:hypothetical protein